SEEMRRPDLPEMTDRLRSEATDARMEKADPADLKARGRRLVDGIAIEYEKLTPKQRDELKELRTQLCLPGDDMQKALIKEQIRETAPELAKKFDELAKLVSRAKNVDGRQLEPNELRPPSLRVDDGKLPDELKNVLPRDSGRHIGELKSAELFKTAL